MPLQRAGRCARLSTIAVAVSRRDPWSRIAHEPIASMARARTSPTVGTALPAIIARASWRRDGRRAQRFCPDHGEHGMGAPARQGSQRKSAIAESTGASRSPTYDTQESGRTIAIDSRTVIRSGSSRRARSQQLSRAPNPVALVHDLTIRLVTILRTPAEITRSDHEAAPP